MKKDDDKEPTDYQRRLAHALAQLLVADIIREEDEAKRKKEDADGPGPHTITHRPRSAKTADLHVWPSVVLRQSA